MPLFDRVCVWLPAFLVLGTVLPSGGCAVLRPEPIHADHCNLPPSLLRSDEPQFERGKPRPVIDAFGWVWGIPTKLLIWNCKAENHNVSPETEQVLANYLAENQLDEIKVRVNQYRPLDDWKRLTRHKGVAWPWRYTFGTISVLGETLIPGRLFGGDHYNPYTGTIHLYSDLASVAIHEGAHAKDFARRDFPGTYAAAYMIPFVPLWHERLATNDALAYFETYPNQKLRREAYHVLYPAYGTYVGSSLSYLYPPWGTPIYYGGVLAGHAVGRWQTSNWGPDQTMALSAAEPSGGTAPQNSFEELTASEQQATHKHQVVNVP